MWEFLPVALISGICGILLTPTTRRIALSSGLIDHPDGRRKLHLAPIALGGGVAVFTSAIIAVIVAGVAFSSFRSELTPPNIPFLLGLFFSSLFIVTVGLMDDRYHLRGRQKLLGQFIAASILIASGLHVERVQLLGTEIPLGLLSYPFTMFWLLGAINALNLIDGLDGLASSVGAILSFATACMAIMNFHVTDTIIALALCGALLGFLIYNFPPASIYLGDAGSMLIGLVLGALAMRSSFKTPATVALMAPTVIWAIPIFDVGMAILRRKLTGRSIYDTDRGHLHHCLLRNGFSGTKTLFWIGMFCSVTCVGALISIAHKSEWMALITALSVFFTLVVTRLFGYGECMLLGRKLKSVFWSLIPNPNTINAGLAPPVHARLTGTRDWEVLWETLTEYAERFDLTSVQLNVNLPALNEEYHVNWNRRDRGPERQQWTTDIPLSVNQMTVGRLRISGQSTDGSICSLMGDLIAGLKPFEMQISSLLADQLNAVAQPVHVASIDDPELIKSSIGP